MKKVICQNPNPANDHVIGFFRWGAEKFVAQVPKKSTKIGTVHQQCGLALRALARGGGVNSLLEVGPSRRGGFISGRCILAGEGEKEKVGGHLGYF